MTLSPAWVAYDDESDRYFLVSADQTLALPTPAELHGHFADLIADEADRLHCHRGFVPWPPSDAIQPAGEPHDD